MLHPFLLSIPLSAPKRHSRSRLRHGRFGHRLMNAGRSAGQCQRVKRSARWAGSTPAASRSPGRVLDPGGGDRGNTKRRRRAGSGLPTGNGEITVAASVPATTAHGTLLRLRRRWLAEADLGAADALAVRRHRGRTGRPPAEDRRPGSPTGCSAPWQKDCGRRAGEPGGAVRCGVRRARHGPRRPQPCVRQRGRLGLPAAGLGRRAGGDFERALRGDVPTLLRRAGRTSSTTELDGPNAPTPRRSRSPQSRESEERSGGDERLRGVI